MMQISPILLALLVSAISCSRAFAFAGNLSLLPGKTGTTRRERQQHQHLKPFFALPQAQHEVTLRTRRRDHDCTVALASRTAEASATGQSHRKSRNIPVSLTLGRKRFTRLGAAASTAEGEDSNAAEPIAAVTEAATQGPAGEAAAGETAGAAAGVDLAKGIAFEAPTGVDLAKGIAFEAPKPKREEVEAEEASKKVRRCV